MLMLKSTHRAILATAKVQTEQAYIQLRKEELVAVGRRREIRRLTDIIVSLKEQGQVLPGVSDDPEWSGGSYSIEEIEQEAAQRGDYDIHVPTDDEEIPPG